MGYNRTKQNMTHKIQIVSLLLASIMLFFVGCKKNNTENETPDEPSNETPEETLDELIPEEILQLLDNCPVTNYQDPSVFGFNGKSDNPLDNLFAAMCSKAMELTNGNTIYGEGDNEQKGLAYVNGQGKYLDTISGKYKISYEKDYTIPRIGTNSVCDTALYGIDCSGFIAHVMNAAGVGEINVAGRNVLVEMTARQQVDYFKNKLKRLRTSHYTGIVKVEEFESIETANIKNGDIIYYLGTNNDDHIGMFLKNRIDGKPIMFQSAGSRNNQCYENKRTHTPPRGPIQLEMSPGRLEAYFHIGSGHAGLLRITADTNWVDLGLPSGILWATRNIGANSPEQRGYYLAWGETQEKPYYDWIHYNYWTGTVDLYGNIINGSITKYNEQDGLTTLQSADDAATTHWSHLATGCRMPTYNDWNELITHCTPTWKTRNGVKGVLFTAQNGNSLFLPAVGFRHEGGIFDGEHYEQYDGYGFYWTSSLNTANSNNASYVRFKYETETPVLKEYLRLFGLPIRSVRVLPTN